MTHPNSTAYRAAVEALANGDVARFVTSVAEDVRWWELGATEPIVGRSQLERYLRRRNTPPTTEDIHDVLANDEHLVGLIHAVAVLDSEEIDISYAEVLHFNDRGLITKRQAFPSNVWTALKLIEGSTPAE